MEALLERPKSKKKSSQRQTKSDDTRIAVADLPKQKIEHFQQASQSNVVEKEENVQEIRRNVEIVVEERLEEASAPPIDLHALSLAVQQQSLKDVNIQRYPSVFDELETQESLASAPVMEVLYPTQEITEIPLQLSTFLPDEFWSSLLQLDLMDPIVPQVTENVFTRHVREYESSHHDSQSTKLQTQALEAELRLAAARAWILKKQVKDVHGTCGDGRRVKHSYTTESAELQEGQLRELENVMEKLRKSLKTVTFHTFKSKLTRLWLTNFVQNFTQRLSTNQSLSSLAREYLTILFHFENSNLKDVKIINTPTMQIELEEGESNVGSFTKDVRTWISTIVNVLLQFKNPQDIDFLLPLMMQSPGIGQWGAWFYQPQEPAHYLWHLHKLLSPQTAPNNPPDSIYQEKIIENVDILDSDWIVVQDVETTKSVDYLLTDEDYLALLDQFDIGWTLQRFAEEKLVEGDALSMFAFANLLVKTITIPTFSTQFTSRFSATLRRIGLLLSQIPNYLANTLEGHNLSSLIIDNGGSPKTWQSEFDALCWRCVRLTLTTPGRSLDAVPGLWSYLSTMPLSHLSLPLLWRIVMEITTSVDPLSVFQPNSTYPRTVEEWESTFSTVPTPLIRLLSKSPTESSHILDFLGAIAHSCTKKENGHDLQVVVAYTIFSISYLDVEHRESLHKIARTWLSSMCVENPSLVTILFDWTRQHEAVLGEMTVYLFSQIPVEKWIITDAVAQGLESLLTNGSLEFAKCVLDRLNWQSLELVPKAIQRRLAISLTSATILLDQQNASQRSLVRRGTETLVSAASTMVNMTGYVKTDKRKSMNSYDYQIEFEKWCWQLMTRMQLYEIPIGDDLYILAEETTDKGSSTFALSKPYIPLSSPLVVSLREASKQGHGLSSIVLLCLCDVGHRFNQFLEGGMGMLKNLFLDAKKYPVAKDGIVMLLSLLAGTFAHQDLVSKELAQQIFDSNVATPETLNLALSTLEKRVMETRGDSNFLISALKFWVECCLIVPDKAKSCLDALAKFSRTRGLSVFQSALSSTPQSDSTWKWVTEKANSIPRVAALTSVVQTAREKLPSTNILPRFLYDPNAAEENWWYTFEILLLQTRNGKMEDIFAEWQRHVLQISNHPLVPIYWQIFFILYFYKNRQGNGALTGVAPLGIHLTENQRTLLRQRLTQLTSQHAEETRNSSGTKSQHYDRLSQLFNAMILWLDDSNLLGSNVNMSNFGIEYFPTRLKRMLDDDMLERVETLLWWDLVDWSHKGQTLSETQLRPEKSQHHVATSSHQPLNPAIIQEPSVPLFDLHNGEAVCEKPSLEGDLVYLMSKAKEYATSLEKHTQLDKDYLNTLKLLYRDERHHASVEVPCQSIFRPGVSCTRPAKLDFDQESAIILTDVKEKLAENRKKAEKFTEVDVISTAICVGLLKMECSLSSADSSVYFEPFDKIDNIGYEYPPLWQLVQLFGETVAKTTCSEAPSSRLVKNLTSNCPDWKFQAYLDVFEPHHAGVDEFVDLLGQVLIGNLPTEKRGKILDKFDFESWLQHANLSQVDCVVDLLISSMTPDASAHHLKAWTTIMKHQVGNLSPWKKVLNACEKQVNVSVLQTMVDLYHGDLAPDIFHHLSSLFAKEKGCLFDTWGVYLPSLTLLLEKSSSDNDLLIGLVTPWLSPIKTNTKMDSSILLYELTQDRLPWLDKHAKLVHPWLLSLLKPLSGTDLWQIYIDSVKLCPPDYMILELQNVLELLYRDNSSLWKDISLHHDLVPLATTLRQTDAFVQTIQEFIFEMGLIVSWNTNLALLKTVSGLESWSLIISLLQNIDSFYPDAPTRSKLFQELLERLQAVDWKVAMTNIEFSEMVYKMQTHWSHSISSTVEAIPTDISQSLSMCLHALRVMLQGDEDKLLKYVEYVSKLIEVQGEKMENFTLVGVKNAIVESLEMLEGTSVFTLGWKLVFGLYNRSKPESPKTSGIMSGLELAISQTQSPLLVVKEACRTVANVESLSLLLECAITRDRLKSNRDTKWKQIAEAIHVPELEKQRFIKACIHNFCPLTLYAHIVQQVDTRVHDESLKKELTHDMATWIASFPVAKMDRRHQHVNRLLALFVKYAQQTQGHLDVIRVGEALLSWADEGNKSGLLNRWFSHPSSQLPVEFREFCRMIGIIMLNKVEGHESFDKIVKKHLAILQSNHTIPAWHEYVEKCVLLTQKEGGLNDLLNFVDDLMNKSRE